MTKHHTTTLEIPNDVRTAINAAARDTHRDFQSVANEILDEGVKMRRVPGIIFADGINGRVPQIAGTGLEVFEIVGAYRALGENWNSLQKEFDWLSENQLKVALTYAECYPHEVEERIQREERWTPDMAWSIFPHMKPPWR